MQLTIRIPEDQMGRIEHIAHQMGLKKSDVTRIALKRFIDEYCTGTAEKPFDTIKHLLGIVESGVPDLGQHHRKHVLKKMKHVEK